MNAGFAWLGTLAALSAAGLLGWVINSTTPVMVGDVPVVWICIVIAFLIQVLGFVVAWTKRTESFFDALGSVTFISVSGTAMLLTQSWHLRNLLVFCMVAVWAIRLGTFLSGRIRRTKVDRRFNQIRNDFSVFFMTWTLQGLWAVLTLGPVLVLFTATESSTIDLFFFVGAVVWGAGLAIEWIADHQKTTFAKNPENEAQFIDSGLWAWSQHPNYFGEIALWLGIAIVAYPHLSGWQHLCLISPVFVYLLLVHISGIRMLDARARRRWGEDEAYKAYTKRTSKLVLMPPRAT